MSDQSAPLPAPASASARPDVGMVFDTLLASGDATIEEQP